MLKNLPLVYVLSKNLKIIIFNQDITIMSNVIRSKTKREQIIKSRTHQTFSVETLEWKKNTSPLSDKDHALKFDIQIVTKLSQSKPINSII